MPRRPKTDRPVIQGLPRRRARPARALGIAVALHLVVGALLLQFLTLGHGLRDFFGITDREAAREERLTYIQPAPREVPPEPPRQPVARQAAPGTGASPGGAVAPMPAAPDTGAGGGGLGGTGGPGRSGVGAVDPAIRGVAPVFNDPRVWGAPGTSARVARTGTDRLDSVMGSAIAAARDSVDSLARANGLGGRRPGDWTVGGAGGKWGWDEAGIRLGKVTIPNALLALLPLNAATAASMSANPVSMDRERRLAASRADIQRFSQQAPGDAEFRRAVKELRERKEREKERQRAKAEAEAKASPPKAQPAATAPPPVPPVPPS
jgi:hypothetical protein